MAFVPRRGDLYLQMSNRFKPAAAVAALMDMEDLGRYLSQGLEEMARRDGCGSAAGLRIGTPKKAKEIIDSAFKENRKGSVAA